VAVVEHEHGGALGEAAGRDVERFAGSDHRQGRPHDGFHGEVERFGLGDDPVEEVPVGDRPDDLG
jgi:hypothetical protein